MRRGRLIVGVAATLLLVGVGAWLFAPAARGEAPAPVHAPRPPQSWPMPDDRANDLRLDALRRARIRIEREPVLSLEPVSFSMESPARSPISVEPLVCRYLYDEPSGTSSKFDCVLENGYIIKVKYGRNPEIHGETAASMLFDRLGYAADHVRIVPLVRCYGCPRYPFFMSQMLRLFGVPHPLQDGGYDNGFTDFRWVSVESRFDAAAIESEETEGWAWYELVENRSPREELDAFRLLAAFLAHWDNKSDNQRLVCLDEAPAPDGTCHSPLLMIQDLGATFGPVKVNLSSWSERPLWQDREQCRITMKDMPWEGATFPDAQISEAGRIAFGQRIGSITDAEVRRIFFEARFHEFHSGTPDEKDLDAWVSAFRRRVDQIINAGPCPG